MDSNQRVLVIDSDAVALGATARLLEDRGFDVVAAGSVPQIIEALGPGAPRVVIIEPQLEGRDGFELCRSILDSCLDDKPVVLLASRKLRGKKPHFRCKEVGAQLFLELPEKDQVLVQAVARVLADGRHGIAPTTPEGVGTADPLDEPDEAPYVDERFDEWMESTFPGTRKSPDLEAAVDNAVAVRGSAVPTTEVELVAGATIEAPLETALTVRSWKAGSRPSRGRAAVAGAYLVVLFAGGLLGGLAGAFLLYRGGAFDRWLGPSARTSAPGAGPRDSGPARGFSFETNTEGATGADPFPGGAAEPAAPDVVVARMSNPAASVSSTDFSPARPHATAARNGDGPFARELGRAAEPDAGGVTRPGGWLARARGESAPAGPAANDAPASIRDAAEAPAAVRGEARDPEPLSAGTAAPAGGKADARGVVPAEARGAESQADETASTGDATDAGGIVPTGVRSAAAAAGAAAPPPDATEAHGAEPAEADPAGVAITGDEPQAAPGFPTLDDLIRPRGAPAAAEPASTMANTPAVAPRPARANESVVPAELLRDTRVEPRYPAVARRLGRGGTVVLRATVGADGSVGDIEVVEEPAGRLGFGKAASEAVRRWRYEPARRGSVPVETTVTIEIAFAPN